MNNLFHFQRVIRQNIINIGDKNLQYCFLSPIRFGKEYLGCLKQTISEEVKKGEKIKLNIFIIFDDVDEDEDENDINLNAFNVDDDEDVISDYNLKSIPALLIYNDADVRKATHYEGEPIIVLLVYESPKCKCAERPCLQKWFKDNGYELKEWKRKIN